METILMVFVGILCLALGVRTYCAEERNTIFNKRSIMVTDVAKYNHMCAYLIIGYGVIIEGVLYFMFQTTGILNTVCMLLIVILSFGLAYIYAIVERKHIKR